jgi:hypothetical protein
MLLRTPDAPQSSLVRPDLQGSLEAQFLGRRMLMDLSALSPGTKALLFLSAPAMGKTAWFHVVQEG